MPRHYTKNTVEASVWCNHCGKMTPWRILGGKRAYCIPCYERRAEPKPPRPPKPEQGNLW
jgi:formylmethanofuran dehydrogenase subunit E